MKEAPLWKQRLEAWSHRPPGMQAEEARRRVQQRIARRMAAPPTRRWLVAATALAASAALAVVLIFGSYRRPDAPPNVDVQASTLVLELRSGSTLYLTTWETSR